MNFSCRQIFWNLIFFFTSVILSISCSKDSDVNSKRETKLAKKSKGALDSNSRSSVDPIKDSMGRSADKAYVDPNSELKSASLLVLIQPINFEPNEKKVLVTEAAIFAQSTVADSESIAFTVENNGNRDDSFVFNRDSFSLKEIMEGEIFVSHTEESEKLASFDLSITDGNETKIDTIHIAYQVDLGLLDLDEDGYIGNVDCNDADKSIHPEAPELCDLIDSNCDGSMIDGFDNYDNDKLPNCVDTDDDNDSILDENDLCTGKMAQINWESNPATDQEGDGCQDDLERAECIEGTVWNASAHECVPVGCETLPIVEFSTSADEAPLNHGEVATFTCADGYFGDDATAKIIAACEYGEWVIPNGSCQVPPTIDDDNDGISNFLELKNNCSDPQDQNSKPVDGDGDGFCKIVGEFGSDCNDDSIQIHPDRFDLPFDGVDANCDGSDSFYAADPKHYLNAIYVSNLTPSSQCSSADGSRAKPFCDIPSALQDNPVATQLIFVAASGNPYPVVPDSAITSSAQWQRENNFLLFGGYDATTWTQSTAVGVRTKIEVDRSLNIKNGAGIVGIYNVDIKFMHPISGATQLALTNGNKTGRFHLSNVHLSSGVGSGNKVQSSVILTLGGSSFVEDSVIDFTGFSGLGDRGLNSVIKSAYIGKELTLKNNQFINRAKTGSDNPPISQTFQLMYLYENDSLVLQGNRFDLGFLQGEIGFKTAVMSHNSKKAVLVNNTINMGECNSGAVVSPVQSETTETVLLLQNSFIIPEGCSGRQYVSLTSSSDMTSKALFAGNHFMIDGSNGFSDQTHHIHAWSETMKLVSGYNHMQGPFDFWKQSFYFVDLDFDQAWTAPKFYGSNWSPFSTSNAYTPSDPGMVNDSTLKRILPNGWADAATMKLTLPQLKNLKDLFSSFSISSENLESFWTDSFAADAQLSPGSQLQ